MRAGRAAAAPGCPRTRSTTEREHGDACATASSGPGSCASSTCARSRACAASRSPGSRRGRRRTSSPRRRARAASATRACSRACARWCPNVDVVAIFNAELLPRRGDGGDRGGGARRRAAARPHLREAARAQPGRGAPRGRARRRDRRAHRVLREPDPHEDAAAGARAARTESAAAMGPLTLVRAAEEHGGPHSAWFWDPTQQGGGVLSDMGCHCLAVGWYLLTPPGRPTRFLEPQTVSAHVGLLKWGQPRWRAELLERHGVDYARTPAEDFATGLVTYRNPETGQRDARRSSPCRGCTTSRACGCSSTGSARATRSRRTACARRSKCSSATPPRRRSPTPSWRSRRRPRRAACSRSSPTSPTSTATPTRTSTRSPRSAAGRSALLDFDYGLEIVRLTMAAYLSAEQGRVVDLTDDGDARRARDLRAR